MDGTALILRVRSYLKDVEDKTRKGEFWDDRQILLALNASQDIFINFCISNKLFHLMSSLLTNTGYTDITVLPSNYLHYASAKTGTSELTAKTARVFIGGVGENYKYSLTNGAFILRQTLEFRSFGSLTFGILYYYRKPGKIGIATIPDTDVDLDAVDFDDYIYNDIIAEHASVLLGIKEVQTQREFKKEKRLTQELVLQPRIMINYLRNYEKVVERRQDVAV